MKLCFVHAHRCSSFDSHHRARNQRDRNSRNCPHCSYRADHSCLFLSDTHRCLQIVNRTEIHFSTKMMKIAKITVFYATLSHVANIWNKFSILNKRHVQMKNHTGWLLGLKTHLTIELQSVLELTKSHTPWFQHSQSISDQSTLDCIIGSWDAILKISAHGRRDEGAILAITH